jgi:hypothetical protein
MADIVNLRRVRKAKARLLKEQQAEANRLKFGRTRAERETLQAEHALTERRLDATRLQKAPSEPGSDRSDDGI